MCMWEVGGGLVTCFFNIVYLYTGNQQLMWIWRMLLAGFLIFEVNSFAHINEENCVLPLYQIYVACHIEHCFKLLKY